MIESKYSNKTSGFTIVESLVAILILMVTITAVMTLVQSSLSTASIATKQLTASFLAHDAFEYVRAGFSENKITGSTCSSGGCSIDTVNAGSSDTSDTSLGYKACATGSPCGLLYLDNNKQYVHTSSGAEASQFSRWVKIDDVTDGLNVEVRIDWKSGTYSKTNIFRTILKKWN
jgi:type II secretory pathway pseudopilin PulG